MSARIAALSASLLLIFAATAASAADLGGAPPEEGRYYPPYAGDQRSGYGYEEEEVYEERRGDAYLPPMREGRRYAERDDGVCLPRHEIRRSLADQGWHDFRNLDRRGDIAVVEARRPSGRLFELRVDSCSGRILRTYALDGRHSYGDEVARRYPRHHRGAY